MVVFVSLYGFRMVHMKLSCCSRKLFFFRVFFFSQLFGTSFGVQFFQLLFHLSFCCLNNSTDTELFFRVCKLVKGFMSGWFKWIAMSWNVWQVNILDVLMAGFMIQSDFRQYFSFSFHVSYYFPLFSNVELASYF